MNGITIQQFDLHILKDGSRLQLITLSREGSYSIGRSETCAIAIDDPGLSRIHAVLTLNNGQLSIRDSSSNGTDIDGLTLKRGEDYAMLENTAVELAGGVISLFIDIEKYQVRAPANDRDRLFDKDTPPDSSEIVGKQIFDKLKGAGELVIGRSQSCDLVFPSLQVSRKHAILRMQGLDITLEDLDTTNGTFVNGARISGTVVVQPSDQISICSSIFALDAGVVNLQYAIVANNIEKVYPRGFVGLNKMSLRIPSREFVALMGPSGCGKSTLLKCLNGASPATGGEITIQGLRLNNANFNTLKKHIGYVPQDDIVHGELSVEKTLFYAAKLRMAKDVSNAEINEKIDQVLQSLNLDASSIRQNRIHDLSGGQRKRISIAVELLNDPTILFLDEPTSPLDPETIEDFLSCIRSLVQKGQTVIMVTHKPSDLSYVDKVIFLSKGGFQTYYGDKREVLDYFKRDSIIEVYSLMKEAETGKKWNMKWLQQHPIPTSENASEALKPKPATSMMRQYFWLSLRYFNIKWNDTWNLLLLIAQPFIIGFLLVFIFESLQLSVLFMMAVAAIWFGVSNASKEIVSELAVYERERMFNLNIVTYILSKITVLAVIAFAQVLIFVSIIYYAYHSQSADVKLWGFVPNVAFMFFLSVSATVFGLFLSAVFNSAEKVMTFVPIALMPQIMLAGIIARVDSDLKILFSYFTLGRWGTEGFAHIQDALARRTGHWADQTQTVPASVMQYLPQTGEPVPAEDVPVGSDAVMPEIQMVLQPQGAMDQLSFYDPGSGLLSLFPENLSGVTIAIMALNGIFLVGVYVALKRKDSRFV